MKLPEYVIIDVSDLRVWVDRLHLPESVVRDLIIIMMHGYPYGQYTDGLFVVLENHLNFDNMAASHLDNLEITMMQMCENADSVIAIKLSGYDDQYKFVSWLEPWSVVFRREYA